MLSLVLQDTSDTFTDIEELIEDMGVLFLAGSKTTQATTTNLIVTMLHEPEEFRRLRAKIDPFMESVKENIIEGMTIEDVDQLDFVKMAYQEALRRDCPAPLSMPSTMTRNVKINGVELSAGDPFCVMIHYVLNDPKQWKEPHRFVPDRFDMTSPWSKKPDGSKRSPFAFTPFLGGVRVCMGKSFAEMALRTTIPLWFHFFDFELVEDEH